MASRHSAFYSPLLSCVQFLRKEGHQAPYSVLAAGQRGYVLLRDGAIDVLQSAVSSNWKPREQGIEPLPVHFAQINQRDGFFLAAREADPAFEWKKLEGRTLLADHGLQPLVMLKFAVRSNGAEWSRIKVIDAGTPEKMEAAFRAGTGDYLHMQGPVASGEIVASVGAAMPPVAFSSLSCARSLSEDRRLPDLSRRATRGPGNGCNRRRPTRSRRSRRSSFPNVDRELLASTIGRYQALGCWQGGIQIPKESVRAGAECVSGRGRNRVAAQV